MEVIWAEVDKLQEYPNNARRGNIAMLVESLKTNTQYKPIVVQKSTNYVLAGNHILRAAKQLGWERIYAVFIDCDYDQGLRIVLADNRASDLGEYNDDILKLLLESVTDFKGTGYTEDDLKELDKLAGVETTERPEIEFSLALREENNYLVLVFDNALDWQAAQTTFGLKTVQAWDSRPGFQRMGIGRVIPGQPILNRLNNVISEY
jgi:hypothetical protein